MKTPLYLFFGFLLLAVSSGAFSNGEETENGKAGDLFVIPENKTVAELLEYARETIRETPLPTDMPPKEILDEVVRRAEFLLKISETALEKNPDKNLLPEIHLLKFEALEHLARTNDPKHVETLENWLDEMDRLLPKSRQAKLARAIDMQRQVGLFLRVNRTEKEFQAIKRKMLALVRREPMNFPPALPLNLVEISQLAEDVLKRDDLVDATGKELIEVIRSTSDPGLHGMIPKIEAATHVPGQTIVLEGTTLDGKKFDWEKYRGKIVLVDFFTSWCIPCIEEFPRLKEIREKYKEKGFEIVGVGMDELKKIKTLAEEQELPWTIVSEDATIRNRMKSIGKRYAIRKYPTFFLIDGKGRLIDAKLRISNLEETLERLFEENQSNKQNDGIK